MTEMTVGPACVSALFYNREIQGGHIGPPLQNFFWTASSKDWHYNRSSLIEPIEADTEPGAVATGLMKTIARKTNP